jgi:hypothetical protein
MEVFLTVATYVMCFLVVGVLAAVAIIYQRWWWGSRRVPDAIARAERTNLLQAIEEAATEPQMHVTLSGFWRGNGWSRREKADLLRPLIEQRVLHIPYSSEQPQRFFEHVWYDAFGQPPGTVILNSRDWTRMATDKSGKEPSIIIGKISGGNNQIGGRENTITQQDLATDQLVALIRALRADADSSPGLHDDAINAADGIESGLHDGRLSEVNRWVKAAATLAESGAGAMEATRKALHAIGVL